MLLVLACLQAGQTQTTKVTQGPIQPLPPVGQQSSASTPPPGPVTTANGGSGAGGGGFDSPITVAEPDRIMITPRMDGKVVEEDWDPFTAGNGCRTYLQWVPGAIYAAGTGPVGDDMVVSLDLGADGWLVGANNLEVRLTNQNGTPSFTVNQLNAANVSGPQWHPLPGFVLSSTVTATSNEGVVTYTLRLSDPGYGFLPIKPTKIAARIDFVPSGQPASPPNAIRSLAALNLVQARSAVLPTDLKWKVEKTNKPFGPLDDATIKLDFTAAGKDAPTKMDIRAEGDVRDRMNESQVPFPPLDGKGNASVDYTSKLSPGSEIGFHVLKATITAADGTPGILEASFRLAPMIDVSIPKPVLPLSATDRSVPLNFNIESFTQRPMQGTVTVTVPAPFKQVNGSPVQKFTLFDPYGKQKQKLEIFVPANTTGTFPISFELDIKKGGKFTYTRYLNIGPM